MLIGGFYSVDGALLCRKPENSDFMLRLDSAEYANSACSAGFVKPVPHAAPATSAAPATPATPATHAAPAGVGRQYDHKIYTNNGRTASVYALQHCAERMKNKVVLLPDYLCLSVISAIRWAGLSYDFYRISANLEIDTDSLEAKIKEHGKNAGMIYMIHYFSVPQPPRIVKELCRLAREYGLLIMEDITQALFSRSPQKCSGIESGGIEASGIKAAAEPPETGFSSMGFGDYIVASTRKWFPMTDGGLCAIRNDTYKDGPSLSQLPPLENAYDESVYKELLISALRPVYDDDPQLEKQAYLTYEKEANASRYVNLTPRNMTDASKHIFFDTDTDFLIRRRIENFRCLYDRLKEIPEIKLLSKDIDDADNYVPFGLALLAEDRDSLYSHLVDSNIIPEIQWILPTDYYEPGQDAKYLSAHNLMLQCDQRYDASDMERVADVIAAYYKSYGR